MKLPDARLLHRRARRLARWTGSIAYRTIVVPLLENAETEQAVDLACRLAADRGARIVLGAPAVLECELPIDAHLDGQLVGLEERLECAAAVAGSYGVGVRREIVRTRPGSLGEEVARVAAERRAELVVVGAPVESRRGFQRAFPREVLSWTRQHSRTRMVVYNQGKRTDGPFRLNRFPAAQSVLRQGLSSGIFL